jgi:hypothetical protein
MGYYIQGPALGKVFHLVNKYNANMVHVDDAEGALEDDKLAVICVVNNGAFEAAGYCFDHNEFLAFTDPKDDRPKTWLTMDKDKAEELSGYKR